MTMGESSVSSSITDSSGSETVSGSAISGISSGIASMVGESSNSDGWSGVGDGNWGGVDSSDSDGWGGVGDNGSSWGLSVDDGVESVDSIGSVGHSSDSTIGLDEGVFSSDDISITFLPGRVVISGKSIGDGVSVVVLWMRVEWLSSDGNLCDVSNGWGVVDWGSVGDGNWGGVGNSDGGLGVGSSGDSMASISQTSSISGGDSVAGIS